VLSARKVRMFCVALSCFPLLYLIFKGANQDLTANPIEYVSQFTGWWSLTFLIITLSITPARKIFNQPRLFPLRRTFGLVTFSYASLHMAMWAFVDQLLDVEAIFQDVTQRPFIYLGVGAYIGLTILALTSRWSIRRRIGERSWERLHRGIYVVSLLAASHFFILVKRDTTEPLLFCLVLLVLLGYRGVSKILSMTR
jgi:sulfoxide reductase heme-binding subunit YedZ